MTLRKQIPPVSTYVRIWGGKGEKTRRWRIRRASERVFFARLRKKKMRGKGARSHTYILRRRWMCTICCWARKNDEKFASHIKRIFSEKPSFCFSDPIQQRWDFDVYPYVHPARRGLWPHVDVQGHQPAAPQGRPRGQLEDGRAVWVHENTVLIISFCLFFDFSVRVVSFHCCSLPRIYVIIPYIGLIKLKESLRTMWEFDSRLFYV